MSTTTIDPARLAIFDSLVSSIAEEMGATLRHTALSPNIKERADFSCAVFDHDGQLLAQAAHIPVHLGAMPESVTWDRARDTQILTRGSIAESISGPAIITQLDTTVTVPQGWTAVPLPSGSLLLSRES